MALAFQIGLDVAQALPAGELRHGHADELIPARGGTKFLATMMLSGERFEIMSTEGFEQLMKGGVMMGQSLNLRWHNVFSTKTLYPFGSGFFIELPTVGQQWPSGCFF